MNIDHAIKLILEKLDVWAVDFIKMLPNLILATCVLVIGLFLAQKIRNFANKKLLRFFPTRIIGNLAINLIYTFCIGVVVFSTLRILKLDKTITTALAGAGIVGIGLAFAFQDIAANFISGTILSFSRPFKINDLIKIKEFEGFVTEMKLRETVIRNQQGHIITIPNKDIFQNPIINYTRYGKRRADIVGGVSQADDLRKVKKVALEALAKIPNIIKEDTSFLFSGLGESTIDFKIRIWVNSDKFPDYLQLIDDVIITIKETFEENDISLPFPIRTLDFAMKGGEKLSDMEINIQQNSN